MRPMVRDPSLRSGFRLRAPASLTPALRLKFRRRDGKSKGGQFTNGRSTKGAGSVKQRLLTPFGTGSFRENKTRGLRPLGELGAGWGLYFFTASRLILSSAELLHDELEGGRAGGASRRSRDGDVVGVFRRSGRSSRAAATGTAAAGGHPERGDAEDGDQSDDPHGRRRALARSEDEHDAE